MNETPPTNLILLQTFHEVARTGSVTAAAAALGRSQPAVSHRLRLLALDLGVPLFEKVGRRLRLTEYGVRLQRECLDLMARSQHIRDRVVRQDEFEGRVALGTLPTVASHLLVPTLSDLLVHHPLVTLSISLRTVERLRERLRTGELDVLMVVGEIDGHGLDVQVLGHLPLVAVVSPDKAPRRKRTVSPAWLRGQRYLSYGGERDPTFAVVERYVRKHGLEDDNTLSVANIETLRELAAGGAGYALIPAYTARRDQELGRLTVLRVEGLDATVPLSIVGRSEQVITPVVDVVRQALLGVQGQLGTSNSES